MLNKNYREIRLWLEEEIWWRAATIINKKTIVVQALCPQDALYELGVRIENNK